MALPPRTPPRFVPTLTEVVQVSGASAAPAAAATTPAPFQRTAGLAAPSASPQRPRVQPDDALTRQSAPAASQPVANPLSAPVSTSSQVSASLPVSAPLPVVSPARAPLRRPAVPSLTDPAPIGVLASRPGVPAVAVALATRTPATATAPTVPGQQKLPDGMEEYMVHRVMQRVDVVLDQRLRDAIATVVQEQTRSVLPRLREEIESVVRHAVYEAVADELASGSSAPVRR